MATLEAAFAVTTVPGIVGTTSEEEFNDKLAELLVKAALARSGFCFRSLPALTMRKPDVEGELPGVGTICLEVYKPCDDPAKSAYMSELTDAVELADVPLDYVAFIDWSEAPSRPRPLPTRSYQDRHRLIDDAVSRLFDSASAGSVAATSCIDPGAGLQADIRLAGIASWADPAVPFERATNRVWADPPWIVENDADAVANKIVNKAGQGQAESRQADCSLLVVDCSSLRLTFDLSLSPDQRTIRALCSSLGLREAELPQGLTGVVVWNPYVDWGDPRRVVAATGGVPQPVLNALAGCPWDGLLGAHGLLARDYAAR